jgi:hypothetical protein
VTCADALARCVSGWLVRRRRSPSQHILPLTTREVSWSEEQSHVPDSCGAFARRRRLTRRFLTQSTENTEFHREGPGHREHAATAAYSVVFSAPAPRVRVICVICVICLIRVIRAVRGLIFARAGRAFSPEDHFCFAACRRTQSASASLETRPSAARRVPHVLSDGHRVHWTQFRREMGLADPDLSRARHTITRKRRQLEWREKCYVVRP